MLVDLDIKDYYKAFINNANNDIKKYTELYNSSRTSVIRLSKMLNSRDKYINAMFNINATKFPNSITNMTYDKSERFEEAILSNFKDDIEGTPKTVLRLMFRYAKGLQSCYNHKKSIELAKKRSNITLTQYRSYLKEYYMHLVHKALIDGYAYHFTNGIGDLMINFWKYKDKPKSTYVNWNETRKRKQEILDAGLKLYNKEEAEIYKLRGLKYDGVPYVVYKTNKEFYNIELHNNKYYKSSNIKFKHANYIPYKFRHMTPEEIAAKFRDVNEIAIQDLGIRHKLICCISKSPTIVTRYIRNDEQYKYKLGEHNSKYIQKAT